MEKDKFIKSRVDTIEWNKENVLVEKGMREIRLYAKSCYDQHYQHIGTICYDIADGTQFVQPVIMGKDKYYYYNRDKMQYYKTLEKAQNYSKNQYIKSVKLKANWQFKFLEGGKQCSGQ
ncbi:MAG: hypothetical protein Unbinned202contig1002_25 [Prokaryotic dsDNA virus sp.]|nr:MAG: hypothetical protein Unbinned202contig1002_25 [Prokaryotic dsDNA virus sp.]|tara:strand:+ start:11979 stop:12335 length:357 start_codon:yes stop_codon:yes gene_type:complete